MDTIAYIATALISGGMALLGVFLSNRHQRITEKEKHILNIKEELYINTLLSLDAAEYLNPFVGSSRKEVIMSDERIELMLELYAPYNVFIEYLRTVNVIEAGADYRVIQIHVETLVDEIKKDLGLKEN